MIRMLERELSRSKKLFCFYCLAIRLWKNQWWTAYRIDKSLCAVKSSAFAVKTCICSGSFSTAQVRKSHIILTIINVYFSRSPLIHFVSIITKQLKKTVDLFTLIKLMYFRLFSYWYCNYTKLGMVSRCSVYGLCFKSLCTYITLFRSFLCRPCMIVRRRQNVLISRFREDVDTRQQFLFLFSEFRYSGSWFNSRKIPQHLTNWTRSNESYITFQRQLIHKSEAPYLVYLH